MYACVCGNVCVMWLQIDETTFNMTFMGRGYPNRVEDVDKTHEDMPSQNIITRVTGPGHYYTCCHL